MASKGRYQIRSIAVVASLAIFLAVVPARAQSTKKTRDPGQTATIKVDGAAVYEAPNFDAPVVEYMDSGKKAKISRKIYPGIGGLGTFFKIRLRAGVFGYIADTDVDAKKHDTDEDTPPSAKEVPEAKPEKAEKNVEKEEPDGELKEEQEIKNSFYTARYMGLGYYSVNYAEEIAGSVQNSQTPMFAFKMTGPSKTLGGLPVDFTLLIDPSAPSFYNQFATSVSGAMVYADFMPFFTIHEWKRFYFYWGPGLFLKYDFWNVKLKSNPTKSAIQSEELDVGLDAAVGAAVKMSARVAGRLEIKYLWENQRYFGVGAAVEFKY